MSATAWAGFQIQSTSSFHDDFQRLSTNGACQVNLLPHYWTARGDAEIPSLALNAAVLLVTAVLSWRLIKVSVSHGRGPTLRCSIGQLTILLSLVLWMANIQARGRVVDDQPHLQTRAHAFYRHPTIIVLRRSVCRFVAGSAMQRGYRASR